MRRLLTVFVVIVVLAIMVAAMAVPAFAVSGQANPKACFGQVRATGASDTFNTQEGKILSTRKGDNARQNAEFRNNCQP